MNTAAPPEARTAAPCSNRWRRRARAATLALFATLLAACASPVTQTTIAVKKQVLDSLHRYEFAYVLQAGDAIEIYVDRHPELSRKTIIRPDGFISMPIAEEVKADGKTPRQLAKDVTARLARRLIDPEVTVMVDNAPEPMVFVVGKVGAPKALPLRQVRTVAQALAQSGDMINGADMNNVSVIRVNSDGRLESDTVTLEGDYPSQPEIYMALNNMPLKANDLILVPQSYRGQAVQAVTDINTMLAPLLSVRLLQVIY